VDNRQRLEAIAEALSIPTAEHHILLCADQTTDKCAPREETNALWAHLKNRLKSAGLTSAPPSWSGKPEAEPSPAQPGGGRVLRNKADCLRICEQGAICVVYPEGTWYAGLDIAKLDRIIDEHLAAGQPVTELIFAIGDLGG
jgi:(2Fe-2S) ferredoxin